MYLSACWLAWIIILQSSNVPAACLFVRIIIMLSSNIFVCLLVSSDYNNAVE